MRLQGPTRIETATAIAADIGPAPVAMIVNAWNYPDALAAGAAAGAAGTTHILLSDAGDVPSATAGQLAAGGYQHRIVFGGQAVVSDATYQALRATERIAGSTRVGTAAAAARRLMGSALTAHRLGGARWRREP